MFEWDSPIVMGIINVTPDSFYAPSRCEDESRLLQRVEQIIHEGGMIVDIGGCSTRPNGSVVSEEEEWARLDWALRTIRNAYPDIIVSLDTFRPTIAKRAIEQYHVNLINDVSGGDEPMYRLVGQQRVPYILTYTHAIQSNAPMTIMSDMIDFFERRLDQLHRMGAIDVVLDPGFGFGKTLEQNWIILRHMSDLELLNTPLLVGVSRKSMVYQALNIEPEQALAGTIATTILALRQGAAIVRAHDIQATQQTIQIYQQSLC